MYSFIYTSVIIKINIMLITMVSLNNIVDDQLWKCPINTDMWMSFFSAAVIKHHDQNNLEKKHNLGYICREISILSGIEGWQQELGMATMSRSLRAHKL